jgi:hypothetical protein
MSFGKGSASRVETPFLEIQCKGTVFFLNRQNFRYIYFVLCSLIRTFLLFEQEDTLVRQ